MSGAGVLSRILRFLEEIQITLSLVFVISCVYFVQILLLVSGTRPETLQWLFTFESLWPPAPGWILSGISHGFSRPVTHFGVNAFGLLIVGGIAEQHLRRGEYIAFFVITGFLGSIVTAVFRPGDLPTLGASAALYGLLMYSTLHYVRNHEQRLSLVFGTQSVWPGIWQNTRTLLVFLIPIVVILQTTTQLIGLSNPGDSAVASHGVGLLAGFLWEYIRAEILR